MARRDGRGAPRGDPPRDGRRSGQARLRAHPGGRRRGRARHQHRPGLLPLRLQGRACCRTRSRTPRSATSSDSTRPSAGDGSTARRLARILTMYGPEDTGAGWPLWIDAWSTALRSPEMAEVSRQLDVRWKDTVAARHRPGRRARRADLRRPGGGAAWRITAMLDGLAVQATVHAGVVSRRQVTAWVRRTAAAELGIDPSALRCVAGVTPTSSPGGRPRPAPGGPARRR